MPNSKDVLEQKSINAESLKSAVDDEPVDAAAEPTSQEVVDEKGKKVIIFKDPLFSKEKRSVVNYTIFRGKWEFEDLDDIDDTDPEKCAIKFVPVRESSNVTIVFKSLKDRLEFMDSIYSDNEMKQKGTGMNMEKFANSKVLKTTGGIIGLGLAGYGIYKMLKGRLEEES